jgi:hypothetical protein
LATEPNNNFSILGPPADATRSGHTRLAERRTSREYEHARTRSISGTEVVSKGSLYWSASSLRRSVVTRVPSRLGWALNGAIGIVATAAMVAAGRAVKSPPPYKDKPPPKRDPRDYLAC